MTRVSVVEAQENLSALIERALSGEHVVITRHGREVVSLTPVSSPAKPKNTMSEIRARRAARSPVGVRAVDELRAMYEDD